MHLQCLWSKLEAPIYLPGRFSELLDVGRAWQVALVQAVDGL